MSANGETAAGLAPLPRLLLGGSVGQAVARALGAALLTLIVAGGSARGEDPAPAAPSAPAVAAGQDAGGGAGATEGDAGTDAGATPAADSPEQDFYFVEDDLIKNKDGTLTWFYVTNHVGATPLKSSIDKLKVPGLTADTKQRWAWQFKTDPNRRRSDISAPPAREQRTDENVLILTFPVAYKGVVEEFLQRFDVPEPQVFIKAKVVEVTLDSNLEYGVSLFFDRGGGDPNPAANGGVQIGGQNENAFFRGFRSSARPSAFAQKFLHPDNTGLSLVFDDLIGDEGTIIAQIEALQERGAANILSEPSILATQGQLATLITGQETPIAEIKISGSSETVATTFKETGIRLDFTPLHIGREYVNLRVRVEVSSITGFLEAKGPSTSVQNPIVAQRNSETVVTIRDGMTLVIGGLYAVSEVDSKSGVPLLGSIPVLGFLFSRTKKTKVKSELDFFITPSILRHRLDRSVFVPPGERRRLKEKKSPTRPASERAPETPAPTK